MGNYEMDFESDHIHRSTGTPRPERVEETTAGLLARGLMLLRAFPAEKLGQWHRRKNLPLTVAGAATDLVPDGYAAPCSLLIPEAASDSENHHR